MKEYIDTASLEKPKQHALQSQSIQNSGFELIKDCVNVSKALAEFCAKNQHTTLQNIDFRLQNLRFFLSEENPAREPKLPLSNALKPTPKFADILALLESSDKDFTSSEGTTKIELSQAQLDALISSPLYDSAYFSISQVCDMRVFPRVLEPLFVLEIDSFKVDICFDEAFCIVEDKGFIEDFYEQVKSALALGGVMLTCKNEVEQNLGLILESIAKNPAKKKEIFCLLKAKKYVPSKQARFRFVPQETWEASNGKAPQNAVFGVREGEQIAFLYKPILGNAGRNLFGEYETPNSIEAQKLITTRQEYIESIDTAEAIIYTAKKEGFIRIENGEFKFFQIPSGALNTRNTPPLLAGGHIDLEISCYDIAEDAIGAGVWCEVGSLKTRGCIAENTRIKAHTLIVQGSTHKSAHIKAYAAQIRTHKGKLECTHCAIENLDNGEVIAQNAKILRANGAKIATDTATIHELKSNNVVFFAKSCVIGRNKGGQNEMIFCANAGGVFAKWSKKASAYFVTQNASISKLAKLAEVWENKQGSATQFLQKMSGFTEYQKQIALKDEAYAARYKEALAQANVSQILQGKIQSLQKQVLATRNQAITSLKTRLKEASLAIKEVWGYDNYVFLAKPDLSALESSQASKKNIQEGNQNGSQKGNALDSSKDLDFGSGFFGSSGLDSDFAKAFTKVNTQNALDSLELKEGQSGEIILDENFKLKSK